MVSLNGTNKIELRPLDELPRWLLWTILGFAGFGVILALSYAITPVEGRETKGTKEAMPVLFGGACIAICYTSLVNLSENAKVFHIKGKIKGSHKEERVWLEEEFQRKKMIEELWEVVPPEDQEIYISRYGLPPQLQGLSAPPSPQPIPTQPFSYQEPSSESHSLGIDLEKEERKEDPFALAMEQPFDDGGWGSGGMDVELFDWGLFRKERDKFPHIGIAGENGGGKSLFAQWLASQFDCTVLAVAPHAQENDFANADLVIAHGMNFGSVSDGRGVDFQDILSGKVNISARGFMYVLHEEMARRLQVIDEKNDRRYVASEEEEIVVILDEFNNWAVDEPELPPITAKLLRQARKAKIRLVPLVQGTEVEAMGCKGQGSIRDQLKWVILADKMRAYLEEQRRKSPRNTPESEYWNNVKTLFNQVDYPAFVGMLTSNVPCTPAIIPDLTEWKKSLPPRAKWAGIDYDHPLPKEEYYPEEVEPLDVAVQEYSYEDEREGDTVAVAAPPSQEHSLDEIDWEKGAECPVLLGKISEAILEEGINSAKKMAEHLGTYKASNNPKYLAIAEAFPKVREGLSDFTL